MTCMPRRILGLILCCTVGAGATAAAIYVVPELRRVPVSRLAANLERKLAEDPKNIQHHINLGRLHGMAFALKTDEAPAVLSEQGVEEPWYMPDQRLVPYQAKPAPTAAHDEAAREHLRKALAHYEAALELNPTSLVAQLGYAWMLQQAGERDRAIAQYRKLIQQAWPIERDRNYRGVGLPPLFTSEAIEYLVPLLDPKADAAEIEELRSRQEKLEKMPRAITPIAVPLDDGTTAATIHDLQARVRFDADGSGIRREWSWIAPNAGWLVFDGETTGSITSGLQLFGNVTFWLFWANGYDALAALDDDGDGTLSGHEVEHLAIWRDGNANGISESGEVVPLEAYGIESLSCRYEDGDGLRFAAISPAGVRLKDGRTRPTYDLLLRAGGGSLTLSVAPQRDHAILQDRTGQEEEREQDVRERRLP